MATANPQGIMALPAGGAPADTGASAQPQLGLDDSYDAIQQGLQNASPDAYAAVNAELGNITPQLDQLPDEVLDQLLQIVQYMHDNPKEYAQCLRELIDAGIISEGDFPEEYDPEFLATIGMVILQARKTRQGAAQVTEPPMPPVGMARGGIAEAAHLVASRGRGQDTMLAHITPKEAKMLRAKGGMGTINPATGLPEYGFFSSLVKAVKSVGSAVIGTVKGVVNSVKDVVNSPLGRIVATVALASFIGPGAFGLTGAAGTAAQMALASGAVTALGGGSLKDVIKSGLIGGATAFFGAPGGAISNFVGGAVTNAAANAAITSGVVGTGIGLLSGQKLQDAVKSGLTAGAISGLSTGATKGFSAKIDTPTISSVSDMAKQANVKGTWNSETGQFEAPGAQTSPVAPQNATTGQPLPPQAEAQSPSGVMYGNNPSGAASVPTAADPLGDFIAQNDAQRALASTPAQEPSGIGALWDKAKGVYDEYISPSGIQERGIPEAEAAGEAAYNRLEGKPESVRTAAYQKAYDAAMPGTVRTYGPAVAAGLGIAGLAGAFTPKPPEPSPEEKAMNARLQAERDRVAANPGAYVPQGLERFGIKYNSRGEIIGSEPWNPASSMGPTEVSGNYMGYTPPSYTAPVGAIGGGSPIYQPFNTASMYTNLMPPQYRADGGMMYSEPEHFALGGALKRGIVQHVVDAVKANNELSPAIKEGNGPAPVAPPPAPVVQPPAPPPTEFTQYQQPFDPNQISELSKRLYPSIYDKDYRDSILSNTAIGNRSGGIASLATGGYPRRTGQISGPGTETSDSIPAMLSDGEFVMTAKAVRGAGKGSRLAGAKKMYALMHQLERNAARG